MPSPKVEDKRHLHRQLRTFKADRTRRINRIKSLLVGQGTRLPVEADFLQRRPRVCLWDGSAVPPGLQARLEREFAGLQFVQGQIKDLEAERRKLLRLSADPSFEGMRISARMVWKKQIPRPKMMHDVEGFETYNVSRRC